MDRAQRYPVDLFGHRAVDLVPEAVPGPLGLGDDALVAAWPAGVFLVETERYLSWERSRPLGGFLDDH